MQETGSDELVEMVLELEKIGLDTFLETVIEPITSTITFDEGSVFYPEILKDIDEILDSTEKVDTCSILNKVEEENTCSILN